MVESIIGLREKYKKELEVAMREDKMLNIRKTISEVLDRLFEELLKRGEK